MSPGELVSLAGGLAVMGGAVFFAAAAPVGRRRWRHGLGAVASVAAVCAAGRWLEIGAAWTAAALAASAGTALSRGRTADVLTSTLPPLLMVGGLASHRIAKGILGPIAGTTALVAVCGGALLLGLASGTRRGRVWFVDLATLGLLGGLALAAAPTALTAWRRAAVAAEGHESAGAASSPLWPLAAAAAAFGVGLAWRVFAGRLQRQKGR
jgi:hypothetical protein